MSSIRGPEEMKRQRLRDRRRKMILAWIGDNIVTIAAVGSAFPDIPKEDISGLIRGMTLSKPRLLDSYPSKQRDNCNRPITCYCKAGKDVWGEAMINERPVVARPAGLPEFVLGNIWGDRIHPIGRPSIVRIEK